jgi:hypothetical protein
MHVSLFNYTIKIYIERKRKKKKDSPRGSQEKYYPREEKYESKSNKIAI